MRISFATHLVDGDHFIPDVALDAGLVVVFPGLVAEDVVLVGRSGRRRHAVEFIVCVADCVLGYC